MLLALSMIAACSAFAPPSTMAVGRSTVQSSCDVVMAAKKGKVNPALFSSGIDPKKIKALEAKKAAAKKEQEALDKKGMPKVNLARFLPNRPTKGEVRIDGSFK